MKWLHSHAEGCVEGMVKDSIMTVVNKINGERELTIVDPPENSEEVQAQLNATARFAEEEAERDDDGHDNVDDVDGETPDGFQSSEFDESIVLGLFGLVEMRMPEESEVVEDEELRDFGAVVSPFEVNCSLSL